SSHSSQQTVPGLLSSGTGDQQPPIVKTNQPKPAVVAHVATNAVSVPSVPATNLTPVVLAQEPADGFSGVRHAFWWLLLLLVALLLLAGLRAYTARQD